MLWAYVMGDMNVNLINQSQGHTDAFTDIMFENSFYSLINKPTQWFKCYLCRSYLDQLSELSY